MMPSGRSISAAEWTASEVKYDGPVVVNGEARQFGTWSDVPAFRGIFDSRRVEPEGFQLQTANPNMLRNGFGYQP